jgi:YgiT-type zinc finger domain-containing protein
MIEETSDWLENSKRECPNGCGETMQLVRRDHLFTRPDGRRVLGKNVEMLECSECGELFIPAHTSKLITRYFQGEVESSGVSEIPTIQAA